MEHATIAENLTYPFYCLCIFLCLYKILVSVKLPNDVCKTASFVLLRHFLTSFYLRKIFDFIHY